MKIREKGQGLVEYALVLVWLVALYEIAGPALKAIIAAILCAFGYTQFCPVP